jgi:glycosyltransferase involved in cell wall biosynthesis
MAGSGIRYWNLARVLAAEHQVTLGIPRPQDLAPPDGVTVVPYGRDESTRDEIGNRQVDLIREHEIVVGQEIPYYHADGGLLRSRKIVIDLYAPWILEKLEFARIDPDRGEPNRADDVRNLNRLLAFGDFFICASERQRDYWLGALSAAGRLDTSHAVRDSDLRTLIDVVPFGLPSDAPEKSGTGASGTFPIIQENDPILLWNGGLWNWLDPLTAIDAVAALVPEMAAIRLVFMGVRSPVNRVSEMSIVEESRAKASSLGLLDQNVFFNDWVPYEERANWLLEADLTLSLHLPTAEARFAYRTRMLDLLWCRLPVISTSGDVLAELVERYEIGEVVPPRDVGAVADAIRRALDDSRQRSMRANLTRVAAEHTWERVAMPLVNYCRDPFPVASSKGSDPASDYLHKLERTYSETAEYARHLEAVIAEQQAALESGIGHRLRNVPSVLWNRTRSR